MSKLETLRKKANSLGQRHPARELTSYERVLDKVLKTLRDGNYDRAEVEKALGIIEENFAAIDESLKQKTKPPIGGPPHKSVSLLIFKQHLKF